MTGGITGVRSDMPTPWRVLLISGSLRDNSTNTAVLRTAQADAEPWIDATLYHGLGTLPHFNPDDDIEPVAPAVELLRSSIRAADALVFSTPEYAGALPGSFKNLLDWTIGDDQPGSIYEKPVAWINTSPRGAEHAYQSLALVLGYAKAVVVVPACVHVPVTATDIDEHGLIVDRDARGRVARALAQLGEHLDATRRATNVPGS
ncbi:MAG TPA: NADPH-dependent FMN reductase [Acidimicrobiia bacterium]|nr:NADPH-dependent FMN reductase [Acidimicrobiia bacterium]